MTPFRPLVSTKWLAAHLDDVDVKVIDGSWRLPGGEPARKDYEKRHIKDAVFFDIDAIADQQSHLPHMLPSPQTFASAVGAMGVSNDDAIVVYDDAGCFSAARVWWTFRAMGHERAAVLDGGLPKWLAEDRPVTDIPPSPAPASYKALYQQSYVCDANDVRARLNADDALILDARPAARFYGEAPEPREGLRSGHMPGAASLPHASVLNDDQTFRDDEKLAALFASAGAAPNKQIVTSCGSGVTAAVLSLALELAGHRDHKLYDGSWADWGDSRHDAKEFPVVAAARK